MTNEKNCILRDVCRLAGDAEKCSTLCGSYISLHGLSGEGGKIANANLPMEYRRLTVKTSPARNSQEEIYTKYIDRYVASFTKMFSDSKETKDRIKNLYIHGDVGVGKTTTAVAIANEFLIRYYILSVKEKREMSQRPIYFLDCNQWQTTYNSFTRQNVPNHIAEKHSENYYREYAIAKDVPFLVIDDLGVRDSTEGFRSDLHDVINTRMQSWLPTVYTSNIAMEELPEVFGESRLMDRVRDLSVQIHIQGNSKRGLRK